MSESDALGILSPGIPGEKPPDLHPDAPRPVAPVESDDDLPGVEALPKEHRERAHRAFKEIHGRAKSAEERVANLEAHLQLAGWTFDPESGNPVAPQPRESYGAPPEPGYMPALPPIVPQADATDALIGQMLTPKVAARAEALGLDPREFAALLVEAGGPLLTAATAPMRAAAAAANVRAELDRLSKTDPHFGVYAGTLTGLIRDMGPDLAAHPRALEMARHEAMGRHFDELVRRSHEPAKVVGRFTPGRWTEGAAPGNQAEPPADSFSEETLEIARRWGVTQEQIDRAAERREVSGRRSRSRRE